MPINKKSNFLDNKSNFLFSFIIRKFINQLMKDGKKSENNPDFSTSDLKF